MQNSVARGPVHANLAVVVTVALIVGSVEPSSASPRCTLQTRLSSMRKREDQTSWTRPNSCSSILSCCVTQNIDGPTWVPRPMSRAKTGLLVTVTNSRFASPLSLSAVCPVRRLGLDAVTRSTNRWPRQRRPLQCVTGVCRARQGVHCTPATC